ncbi:hypothetical protein SUGI_0715810 [Cryptomeria japonica]|nr:hypothetical protein SUGI_0715810 [Cryptomeria japonica]
MLLEEALPLRNGAARDTRTAFVKVFDEVEDAVPPTPSKQRKEEKRKGFAVLGISLMACSFLIVVILLFVWLFICRPKMKSLQKYHKFNPIGLKAFSYKELDAATGGFKIEIGRGAFGTVYKGTWADGRAIAVKKPDDLLKKENPQDGEKEFRTEMGIIGGSYHKILVQLYGFCDQGNHRILVYEFMPNGSLDSHLFKGTNDLDWELRVQIVLGIARGIFYLHEECRAHLILVT